MALSFPSSPTTGQQSTQNGRVYSYAGNNVWELASSSSSVVTAATVSGFPATGTAGVLYAALDTGRIYVWQGAYLEMGVSGGGTDSVLRALFVPPAPTSVTATGGNAQATVSWTAPTVLAQTPVTDYTLQYSSNSGSSWTTFTRAVSTATSATVTGLTNGTAYTFRVSAVNGVGTGAYSTASSAVTPGVSDPYFSNVTMMLHFDGSGTSFVDNAATPSTLTAFGNATQSATQFKFSKSLYLDGSSSYLTAPISSGFEFGTGDFAVEAWIYLLALADSRIVGIGRGANGGGPYSGWLLRLENSAVGWYRYDGSDETYNSASFSFSTNTWYHIAAARTSGTLRLYVNGNRLLNTSDSTTYNRINNDALFIGRAEFGGVAKHLNCYIDDLRITKGSSRGYTGSTITVPTAAFPDS